MSASGSKRSSDRTDLSEISHTVGHEFCTMPLSFARVAKLVDAPGLGPDAVKGVPVRVRPLAPIHYCHRKFCLASLNAFPEQKRCPHSCFLLSLKACNVSPLFSTFRPPQLRTLQSGALRLNHESEKKQTDVFFLQLSSERPFERLSIVLIVFSSKSSTRLSARGASANTSPDTFS